MADLPPHLRIDAEELYKICRADANGLRHLAKTASVAVKQAENLVDHEQGPLVLSPEFQPAVAVELRQKLAKSFDALEDINGRIDAAGKRKSNSYMEGIDVSKLKAPLLECAEQLQLWAQENPESAPRRRGFFG